MIKHGDSPYLECSSKGDYRFSAFFARIKARGNKSIEVLYQAAKIMPDGRTGLTWKEVKGKWCTNPEFCKKFYHQLWEEYLKENPDLVPILLNATGVSDMFGKKGSNCQATSLWKIRQDYLDKQKVF